MRLIIRGVAFTRSAGLQIRQGGLIIIAGLQIRQNEKFGMTCHVFKTWQVLISALLSIKILPGFQNQAGFRSAGL
jgi:hypothetical protein